MNLGKRIRQRRIELKLKQRELAGAVSACRSDGKVLSQQALAALEKRDGVKSEFIQELASALKTNVKWLTQGVGSPDRVDHGDRISDYARYIGENFDKLPAMRQAMVRDVFTIWDRERALAEQEQKRKALQRDAGPGVLDGQETEL